MLAHRIILEEKCMNRELHLSSILELVVKKGSAENDPT